MFAAQEGPSHREVYQQHPVWQCPETGMYVVESYALVKEVLANPSLYSSKVSLSLLDATFPAEEVAAVFREGGVVWTRTLQTNDPPDHKRFRTLVEKVFTFRRVEELDRGMRATVEDLVGAVIAGETFDAVERWAVPLPLRIISEQLGVPAADFWDFKRWSDAAIRAIGLGATREQHVHAAHCAVEFQRYFAPILADRMRRPAGSLVALIADAAADPLAPFTVAEQLSLLHQLMIAGHETTTATLASLLCMVAEDPSLLARVRGAPLHQRRLVEDVLRLHAPVQGLFRVTTAATVLGGMSLPSRAVVSLRLGAANRDPARFGELQSRAESTPSAGHLSFGFGLHHCVGAPLARRELEVALDVISGRFARLMLAIPVTQLTYTRSVMTRSLLTLPLIGTFHAD